MFHWNSCYSAGILLIYWRIIFILNLFIFLTVIVGEVANFAAYAFAPAILVTPLGALSIIIRHELEVRLICLILIIQLWLLIKQLCYSAVLAHIILREKLHIFGILGCALCVVGSTTIVLHAPQEREIESVAEVWDLATEPGKFYYLFSHWSISSCWWFIYTAYFLELSVHNSIHFSCSFSLLCSCGYNSCVDSYISLHTSIWSDPHLVLYWSLFTSGFLIGMFPLNSSLMKWILLHDFLAEHLS